jgi:hypothetical protein
MPVTKVSFSRSGRDGVDRGCAWPELSARGKGRGGAENREEGSGRG